MLQQYNMNTGPYKYFSCISLELDHLCHRVCQLKSTKKYIFTINFNNIFKICIKVTFYPHMIALPITLAKHEYLMCYIYILDNLYRQQQLWYKFRYEVRTLYYKSFNVFIINIQIHIDTISYEQHRLLNITVVHR